MPVFRQDRSPTKPANGTAIRGELLPTCPHLQGFAPIYEDFRPGDIRHSHASIAKAQRLLGYAPTHPLEVGLKETIDWFRKQG